MHYSLNCFLKQTWNKLAFKGQKFLPYAIVEKNKKNPLEYSFTGIIFWLCGSSLLFVVDHLDMVRNKKKTGYKSKVTIYMFLYFFSFSFCFFPFHSVCFALFPSCYGNYISATLCTQTCFT